MKAVKAIYEKGRIELSEQPDEPGPVEVLVVFPEPDPWEAILNEQPLRPSFQKFVEECEQEIKEGKAQPLNFDEL